MPSRRPAARVQPRARRRFASGRSTRRQPNAKPFRFSCKSLICFLNRECPYELFSRFALHEGAQLIVKGQVQVTEAAGLPELHLADAESPSGDPAGCDG